MVSAERELGLKSVLVAFGGGQLDGCADEVLSTDNEHPLRANLKRWRLLWRAIRNFDIVHYNFGRTMMPWYVQGSKAVGSKYPRLFYEVNDFYRRLEDMCDLPLLKRAGKGIVVTYQGDDARQGDFCRTHFEINPAVEVEPGYYTAESDEDKRQRISRFAKYADKIYALNPDLLHILPPQAEFLPYASVNLNEWTPSEVAGDVSGARPVVLHAPTHRGAKGTRYILEAVERLQREDKLDFEFTLVEGLALEDARKLYERADILVDQLLAGWYGGLAVELMALGKSVICYIRETDLKFIPAEMQQDLPVINSTPATIYEVLKEWLTVRRDQLPEVGRRSRAYVERWHDPLKIAARLKGDYESILATKRIRSAGEK
jgi:hypothetical protein